MSLKAHCATKYKERSDEDRTLADNLLLATQFVAGPGAVRADADFGDEPRLIQLDRVTDKNVQRTLDEGMGVSRFDTFDDEVFWGYGAATWRTNGSGDDEVRLFRVPPRKQERVIVCTT